MFWIKLLNRKGSGNSEGLSLEPLSENKQGRDASGQRSAGHVCGPNPDP
jgi:hypothetical protein